MLKIVIVFVSFLALSSSVFAEDVKQFKIDMTTPLRNENGTPMKNGEQATKDDPACEKCETATLGYAVSHALNLPFRDESDLPGEQKWARSLLADRIKDSKTAVLSAPETALIEKLIGKAYPGFVIKQIIPLIDPNHPAPKIAE